MDVIIKQRFNDQKYLDSSSDLHFEIIRINDT